MSFQMFNDYFYTYLNSIVKKYFYNFQQQHISANFLNKTIHLSNMTLNAPLINKNFIGSKFPFQLKAGIITDLRINVSTTIFQN